MTAVLPSAVHQPTNAVQPEMIVQPTDFRVSDHVTELYEAHGTSESSSEARYEMVRSLTHAEREAYGAMFNTVQEIMDAKGSAAVTVTDMNGDPLQPKTGLMAHVRPAKPPEQTRRSITVPVRGMEGSVLSTITLSLIDSESHGRVTGLSVSTEADGEIGEWIDDSLDRSDDENMSHARSVARVEIDNDYVVNQDISAEEMIDNLRNEQAKLIVKAGVYSLQADRRLKQTLDSYGAGEPNPKTAFYQEHLDARNEFNRLRQAIIEATRQAENRGGEAAVYEEAAIEPSIPTPPEEPEKILAHRQERLITQLISIGSAVEAAAGSEFGTRTPQELQLLIAEIQPRSTAYAAEMGQLVVESAASKTSGPESQQLELPYEMTFDAVQPKNYDVPSYGSVAKAAIKFVFQHARDRLKATATPKKH